MSHCGGLLVSSMTLDQGGRGAVGEERLQVSVSPPPQCGEGTVGRQGRSSPQICAEWV